MNIVTKAAVQGTTCGLMIGALLLIGGRVWRPAAVAAQATQPAVVDVMRAQIFQVIDAAGRVRAALSVAPGGTVGLTLVDAAGERRAVLFIESDGTPGLSLMDAEGKPRAGLTVSRDGEAVFAVQDTAGKMRAILGMNSDGRPILALYDAAGKVRAALGAASLEAAKTGEKTSQTYLKF